MNPIIESKYLLSICIPTYNREKYLKLLIDSIISQDNFINTNDIEIIIDDGPSNDNTESLIKNYQINFGDKIKYFRNNKAIGMCPALLEAIELSNGKYTWLIGSDDIITDVSLKELMNIIKNEEPEIILSDRFDFYGDINSDTINKETGYDNVILYGVDNFILYLGNSDRKHWHKNTHLFTFMSIFCFKQELYIKNKKLFTEKYAIKNNYDIKKNYFNYIIILYYNISEKKIVIIRNKILVLARLFNTGWNFGQNGFNIIKDLYLSVNLFRKNYKVNFKCSLFLNYMLLIWFLPYLGYLVRNTPLLKYFYNPLYKIAMRIFYK